MCQNFGCVLVEGNPLCAIACLISGACAKILSRAIHFVQPRLRILILSRAILNWESHLVDRMKLFYNIYICTWKENDNWKMIKENDFNFNISWNFKKLLSPLSIFMYLPRCLCIYSGGHEDKLQKRRWARGRKKPGESSQNFQIKHFNNIIPEIKHNDIVTFIIKPGALGET